MIFALPAEARSAAGICAVSEVLDTYVVASAVPFHAMAEVEMKLVPAAVTVRGAEPALAVFGFRVLSVGVGFWGELPLDVPPPLPQPLATPRHNERLTRLT
jgi:hypothetical protein